MHVCVLTYSQPCHIAMSPYHPPLSPPRPSMQPPTPPSMQPPPPQYVQPGSSSKGLKTCRILSPRCVLFLFLLLSLLMILFQQTFTIHIHHSLSPHHKNNDDVPKTCPPCREQQQLQPKGLETCHIMS